MNRLSPVRSDYLTAQDCSQVFKLMDKDGSGYLNSSEVQEMFNTICGTQVQVANGQAAYTLPMFISTVQQMNSAYPKFQVVHNLMEYIKAHVPDLNHDALTLENCQELLQVMDKDRSGSLDANELVKMFQYMGCHSTAWFEVYRSFGIIQGPEALQAALRKMDHEQPGQAIDDKVVRFLAEARAQGGRPDIDNVKTPVKPAEHDDHGAQSGNRKALLVGVNYIGTGAQLGGCITDARNQKKLFMEQFGFLEENILLLTEDQDPSMRPTNARIREGIKWLLEGAAAGDLLFFHFSGHGTQVPDLTCVEGDGRSECLCPLDCDMARWQETVILDTEINQWFFQELPPHVRCVLFFDCCHSGTEANLQCTREFGAVPDIIPRRFPISDELAAQIFANKNNMVPAATGTGPKKSSESGMAATTSVNPNRKLWQLSGCQDEQTSADAFINNVRQGAFTWAWTAALRAANFKATYAELFEATKRLLRDGNYKQVPSMGTQHPSLESFQFLGTA